MAEPLTPDEIKSLINLIGNHSVKVSDAGEYLQIQSKLEGMLLETCNFPEKEINYVPDPERFAQHETAVSYLVEDIASQVLAQLAADFGGDSDSDSPLYDGDNASGPAPVRPFGGAPFLSGGGGRAEISISPHDGDIPR